MQLAHALRAAMAAATISVAAQAAQAPVPIPDEHGVLALALAMDSRCGFLNVMEHEALRRALQDMEPQSGTRTPLPMPNTDCAGDEAAAAVSAARPAALRNLATQAVVAASLGPAGQPLTMREQELALALNRYLDRVLGADAQAYADPAQAAAQAAIQASPSAARDRLRATLGDAAFQAAVEGAGYRATVFAENWIRLTDNGPMPVLIGRLTNCRSADATIASGFECYLMLRNGQVSAFFRDAPNAARPMTPPAVVRLYVRKPEAAVRTAQGTPVSSTPAWRSNATGYEAYKSGTPFLGLTVYDFGPAASAALLNQTPNDWAQIAVANSAVAGDTAAGISPNLFALEGLITELRLRRGP